jgi:hypothetical protein
VDKLILPENWPLKGYHCAKKKIKLKIKTQCITKYADMQSWEVSLKSPKQFWRCSVDKLIFLKKDHKQAITLKRKILAKIQDKMHN